MVTNDTAQIQLPSHGGLAIRNEGAPTYHAYFFANLPGAPSERRFRVELTPALQVESVTQGQVRIGGTTGGQFEIELVGDGGWCLFLTPGDPELQIECLGGEAIPTETRLVLVTVRHPPEFDGRSSEVIFETVES